MRLRKKDISRAKSTRYLSAMTNPGTRQTPVQLVAYATDKLKSMGYKFRHKKGPKSWKAKRMSTTLRRTIWLGVGWMKKHIRDRAATLMHELTHALEAAAVGFARWVSLYVFDSRYRFSVESQGYRSSVRAWRAMGITEGALRDYANDLPGRFIKSYWILGRRMRKDVRKNMPRIVMMP